MNGTTPEYFVAREWPFSSGRPFSLSETEVGAKVAVIGATISAGLFGNQDPVGRIIRVADVPMTVIGVLEEKGASGSGRDQDDIVFVPISTAKMRLLRGAPGARRDVVEYILVKTAGPKAMLEIERQTNALLRQRHGLHSHAANDFVISNPADTMAAERGATRTLTFLLGAVASVSLLVGGISIMNIMLVSVTERTREIGLRMAVGARRSDIRNQFLVESVILCVIGAFLGILLGVGVALVIAEVADWPVFIGPEIVAFSAFFAAAVGVFFGFYPAHKASKLDPIEALRFE